MKLNLKGFTLIEVMVSILIFWIVAIGWFQALSYINIGKLKIIEKVDITKESFFFSEKLFEEIKKWGTIDFEEYFNRKVVGNTQTNSWHYLIESGFWNFWNNGATGSTTYGNPLYFCTSPNGSNMWTGWCYNSGVLNNFWASGWPQRYGEYAFQFIDHNANENADGWDEDANGNIRWDDDDENLWFWPEVFTGWTDVREIYLISWDKKHRTFFRWNWKTDPNKPSTSTCGTTVYASGCLGTVEFLKLVGKDWGMNHNSGSVSTGSYDGIIDTWIIDPQFAGGAEIIAGSNNQNYRQPLFPDSINVSNFEVYAYPNTDKKLAWKDDSIIEFNPYLKIKMTLLPSWNKRVGIKWVVPKLDFSTTVNLVDYFSK